MADASAGNNEDHYGGAACTDLALEWREKIPQQQFVQRVARGIGHRAANRVLDLWRQRDDQRARLDDAVGKQ